jgi:hypothetical protein
MKQVKITESTFRKQVRNVVREAMKSLLEADGSANKPAPIDPKDLMDDGDDEADAWVKQTQAKRAPAAPVSASDLTDDADTWVAQSQAKKAPVAAKPAFAPIDPKDLMDDEPEEEEDNDLSYPKPEDVVPADKDARREWLKNRLDMKQKVIVKNGHYWRGGRDLGPVSTDYAEDTASYAAWKEAQRKQVEAELDRRAQDAADRAAGKDVPKRNKFKPKKEIEYSEFASEGEDEGSVMDKVDALADKTGLTGQGEFGPDGKRIKKVRGANDGMAAKLEDIGEEMGFTKERARQILQIAFDNMSFNTPKDPNAPRAFGTDLVNPKSEFGPEYGMEFDTSRDEDGNTVVEEDEMDDLVWEAYKAYRESLKKKGLSDIELKQIDDAVKLDPVQMLVGHNHYLDDEEGKARIASGLRQGKISPQEAELMIKAIDQLPAGEPHDFNALRRSGVVKNGKDADALKSLLKKGVWTHLSGRPLVNSKGEPIADSAGEPILDDKGKPIGKPFKMNDSQEDEEFQDFRWFLTNLVKKRREERGFSDEDRARMRKQQKDAAPKPAPGAPKTPRAKKA